MWSHSSRSHPETLLFQQLKSSWFGWNGGSTRTQFMISVDQCLVCLSHSKCYFSLTGWWCNNHLEKWWSSSMGRIIPIYEMENKKCSKPPTSWFLIENKMNETKWWVGHGSKPHKKAGWFRKSKTCVPVFLPHGYHHGSPSPGRKLNRTAFCGTVERQIRPPLRAVERLRSGPSALSLLLGNVIKKLGWHLVYYEVYLSYKLT